MKLRGKVAVVTGGGQGAGRGCAEAMAAAGASVVIAGRTAEKLDAVADGILARGGSCLAIVADVTDESARVDLIAAAVSGFGGVHVLVNAAQSPMMRAADLLDIDSATVTELWESGLVATLALMRAAHPHMVAAGGGSIVNFATGALRRPAHYGVYAGVKAAIETVGRAAAAEWGPDNIRVNTVIPVVESPSMDLDQDAEAQARMSARIPLGRIGRAKEDIGAVVAFLASEDAAYVSGNSFRLDGGSWNAR